MQDALFGHAQVAHHQSSELAQKAAFADAWTTK
jgi:hypothetical protein